ncbi:MAG: glutaredoxin, partial [Gammaproteobacteria bacterium]|nr:glutaredoxin [Gammaproteobacteria bacterium]
MKPVIRMFFKTVRVVLGPFVLLGDRLIRPKGIVRPSAEQQAIDARTQHLALYHFPPCPFCLKTRRTIRRLSLRIETCDAKNDPAHRAALIAGGGKPHVPCLRIT